MLFDYNSPFDILIPISIAIYSILLLWWYGFCKRDDYNNIKFTNDMVTQWSSPATPNIFATQRSKLNFGDIEVYVDEYKSGRPLGSVIWDGAILLCRYWATHFQHVKNKNVLELGGGTGLLGIYLAARDANVTITDMNELIPLIENNIILNRICYQKRFNVKVATLKWGESDNILLNKKYDIIVGADILYVEEAIFSKLLATIKCLMHDDCVVYLAGMRRHTKLENHYLQTFAKFFQVTHLSINSLMNNIKDSWDDGIGLQHQSQGKSRDLSTSNQEQLYMFTLSSYVNDKVDLFSLD